MPQGAHNSKWSPTSLLIICLTAHPPTGLSIQNDQTPLLALVFLPDVCPAWRFYIFCFPLAPWISLGRWWEGHGTSSTRHHHPRVLTLPSRAPMRTLEEENGSNVYGFSLLVILQPSWEPFWPLLIFLHREKEVKHFCVSLPGPHLLSVL